MWELATELQFSSRAASSPNLQALFPAPQKRVLRALQQSFHHKPVYSHGYFVLPRITFSNLVHKPNTEPHCKVYLQIYCNYPVMYTIPYFLYEFFSFSQGLHTGISSYLWGYLKLDILLRMTVSKIVTFSIHSCNPFLSELVEMMS